MTIKDYECLECGVITDLMLKSDDKPKCPICGGDMRVIPSPIYLKNVN